MLLNACQSQAEPARVSVSRQEIPVRDTDRMLYVSPPYGQGNNVECFPYRALDESARFRGGRRGTNSFAVVTLENDYVRLAFLPAVGGRLWQAECKYSGRPLLKSGEKLERLGLWKTGCGYMTSTYGMRFDFPEWGHDPAAEAEWDYMTGEEDGCAWVRLSFQDLRQQLGIEETVTLRDDSAAIEIHTRLSNSNFDARPFKYWTLAYVPIAPDSQVFAPCDHMIYHAAEKAWPWPAADGKDLSIPARWEFDTSLFAAGLRRGVAGVVSPARRSGLARIFPLDKAPGCKLYCEGSPNYVNFYGGTSHTMEENKILPARGVYEWSEYYLPLEGIAGLTMATASAAVYAKLADLYSDELMLQVMAAEPLHARLRVHGEGIALFKAPVAMKPLESQAVSVPIKFAESNGWVEISLTHLDRELLYWRGTRQELLPAVLKTGARVEAGEELLFNVGFEDYDAGQNKLPGWVARVWEGTGDLAVITEGAHQGQHAVRLSRESGKGKIGYYSDVLKTVPGAKYRLQFAFQSVGLEPLHGMPTASVVITDGSGWKLLQRVDLPEVDSGWVECNYVFATPADGGDLCVFLQLYRPGTIWFDDVSLKRQPDDAELKAPEYVKNERSQNIPARPGKPSKVDLEFVGPPLVLPLDRPSVLCQPFALAIDRQDNVYCFDGRYNKADLRQNEFRALKFDRQGKMELAFGGWGDAPAEFFHPGGFAVAEDGTIFVADSGHDRIAVYGADGQWQRAFGSRGTNDNQFAGPARIVFNQPDTLLICDVGNRRVTEWGINGEFRRVFAGAGMLAAPADVAVGPRGDVLIVDAGARCVIQFDADGIRRRTLGGHGMDGGRFMRPALLAAREDGSLLVADTELQRISHFDASGNFCGWIADTPGQLPCFRAITGLALNSSGDLLILDAEAPESIWRYDFKSGQTSAFALESRDYQRPPLAPAARKRGVSIAADGSLLLSMCNGYDKNLLRKYGADGQMCWEFGGTGPAAGQWNRVGQAVVDAAGNHWVLDRGNFRVKCLAPDGRLLKILGGYSDAPGRLSFACSLALGGDGLLYIADTGNQRVRVWDQQGKEQRVLTAGADFFPGPLLVAGNGDTWVLNMPSGDLCHFDRAGKLRARLPALSGDNDWPRLQPLAETPDGNILLVDSRQRVFHCFTPDDAALQVPLSWPANAGAVAQFTGPDFEISAIAFDQAGNLVLAGLCSNNSALAVARLKYPQSKP